MSVGYYEQAERERARAHAYRQQEAAAQPRPVRWRPQPGPQQQAFESSADQIGYGGGAGGGKSDLLLGFACEEHKRSTIYRRVFPSLSGMIERSREIYNAEGATHADDSFNEGLHRWRLGEGQIIAFRAVQYEADLKKYQGQPNDLVGVDEATEFPEKFVRFLMGWNRSASGTRCRLVLTFNPPMDDEGQWVIAFFAPWLDPRHPDKAADGEIRFVVRHEDRDLFFKDLDKVPAELRAPLEEQARTEGHADWRRMVKKRTFFHALLKDNPLLAATGYGATIEALPEPLRSYLKGNFGAAQATNPWQVVPRSWIDQAVARWTPEPPTDEDGTPAPLSALGVDVARGGQDETAIAPRHGTWYGLIDSYPGRSTPDGPSVVALIVQREPGEATVAIDVIGVGGSVYDGARDVCNALAVNVSEKSADTDRSGKLRFANLRSALWWQMRESLDPRHGDTLALPNDPVLIAELCAPRFEVRGGVIHVESKDDLRSRLGRSTNRADALLLSRAADTGWLLA